jgi:hypothetical protein
MRRFGLASLAVGLLAGALVAACGGSSTPKAATPPPFNETTAKQTIISNWQTFFSDKSPAATKVTLVQDGPALQQVISDELKNPLAKGASAKVKTVVIAASHTSAAVTYDLLKDGTAQLKDQTGTAFYEGGNWKVSKTNFCALIALEAQFSGKATPKICAS